MTQVWMLRNSETDIHLFNRYDHLLPSVAISYGACQDVKIVEKRGVRDTKFTVTGKRGDTPFEETVTFELFPVWTEPSHL